MFKPRYLLGIFALAAIGAVGYVMRESGSRTAASLLASAERRLAEKAPDYGAALLELDRALAMSLADDSQDLAREIFLTRARTYVKRGVLKKARTDFTTVQTDFGPESPEVAIEIGSIDLELGQYGAALSTAAAVLADDPTHPGALTLKGRALYETGRLALEQAEEVFDAVLPGRDAKHARALAWRAATLDFDHPYRAASISELGTLPASRGELDGVRRFIDAATSCLTQARAALVTALAREPNPAAMVQLVVLLERGGNWTDTVAFGVAAAVHEDVQRDLDGLASLVTALDELHRSAFAASILSAANESSMVMPPELMSTWCRLLYEAGEWRRLDGVGSAAIAMAGTEGRELRSTAAFFRAFAKLNLERYDEARDDFWSFVNAPPRNEPVPDALARAFYGIAKTHAAKGEANGEFLNLQRATAAAPKLGPEMWADFARAQLAQKLSPATAADSLMRAINLAEPKDRPALTALWNEVSFQAMRALDRTLDGIEAQAKKTGVPIDRKDTLAPTWQFHALGRRYLEARNWNGALAAGDAILRRFPDHILGLDLMIEAREGQGNATKLIEMLLRRNSLYGPHPDTRKIIRMVPKALFTPEQYLKLMELDPQSTGLLEMVDELRAEGRSELAIEGLAALTPEQRTPEASLTLAQLYAESGRLPQALLIAGEVRPFHDEYTAAIGLSFRVASDTRKPDFLATIAPGLLAGALQARLEPSAAERAALWLLAQGETTGARTLLNALDQPLVRNGARLASLGFAQLAARRVLMAEETLDRAEPFGKGPEPEIARIALLAETRRWSEVPREVATLRKLDYKPSPWVDIALLALEERVREASLAAKAALAGPTPEPEWHLVLAATNALLPEEDRTPVPETAFDAETQTFLEAFGDEPRRLLVLLCALETPSGAAWAHRELYGLAAAGGEVWPAWLMARAFDRLGMPERANTNVEAIVRNVPGFSPGWRRLEADLLKREGTRLAPAYASFLERRAEAGDLDAAGDPLAAAIVQLLQLGRAGEIPQALELLGRIGPQIEGSAVGSVNAARVLRVAGLRAEAVAAFSRALDLVPPAEAATVVDEFLALGTQAFLERKLSLVAWRAELAALKTQLPSNPTVSLAWARFERQTAKDGPTGWDLARDEYQRFRDATEDVSLDALEPGSAAEWAEFFLSENPAEAEQMIRAELLKSPGSPDLWRQLGQALEEQGRTDEAFNQYVAVSNILPDPPTMRRAAEILAQNGSDHRLLELTLQRILAVERPTGSDPSLDLLRARSLANSGAGGVVRAIPQFDELWAQRDLLRTPRERGDLGESYAVALLHRGDPADGPFLREVLDDVLPSVTDPLRRDMLQAFENLSLWIPEPVAAEDDAAAEEESP